MVMMVVVRMGKVRFFVTGVVMIIIVLMEVVIEMIACVDSGACQKRANFKLLRAVPLARIRLFDSLSFSAET